MMVLRCSLAYSFLNAPLSRVCNNLKMRLQTSVAGWRMFHLKLGSLIRRCCLEHHNQCSKPCVLTLYSKRFHDIVYIYTSWKWNPAESMEANIDESPPLTVNHITLCKFVMLPQMHDLITFILQPEWLTAFMNSCIQFRCNRPGRLTVLQLSDKNC